MTHHNQPAPEWESDKIKRALDILKGVVERERQVDWEDLQRSIPDAAERNRNLK